MTFERIDTAGKWWPATHLGIWVVRYGCAVCGTMGQTSEVADDGTAELACPVARCGWRSRERLDGWNRLEVSEHYVHRREADRAPGLRGWLAATFGPQR